MKIKFDFSEGVLNLPASVIQKFDRASKKDLKLLFILASDPVCMSNYEAGADALAALAGVSRAELDSAVSFWRGAGIFNCIDDEEIIIKEKQKKQEEKVAAQAEEKTPENEQNIKLKPTDELPKYTSSEIEALMKRRKEAASLIDACEQTLGKMFNTMEINTVLGLLDYLSLDCEYILLLFAYCAKKGKKSLKYIEKKAFSLYEREIDTPAALEEYLKSLDAVEANEQKLRKLFGMKDRALTTKEKSCITKWFGEWKFDFSMIEKAYEITINNINEPSVPYANSILEKWFTLGYKNTDDVDAGIAEYKKSKEANHSGSFDTDEFFEAALKRSYSK